MRVERVPAEEIAPRATNLIDEWLASGIAPDAIAVLCRVNSGLLAVQVLAHDRGLPITAAVGEQFLRRTGVRSALAYLRLACAIADGSQFRGSDLGEVARRPNRRITAKVIDGMRNRSRFTLSTLRAQADALGSADTDRVHMFADDLEGLGRLVRSGDAAAVLRSVRDDVGLGAAMGTLDNSGRGRDASHLDDVTALLAIAAVHPDPATYETWLREHLQGVNVGEDPRGAGQVTLSTVHRVKGLEWDRVIVLGAHDGLMPHRLTDDREEERRVFHVALTRCRDQVVLLADAAAPAPFVDELTTPPPPPAPSRRASGAVAEPASKERVAPPGVPAAIGLRCEFTRSAGEIVELREDAAVLALDDGGRIVVPFHERVVIDDASTKLLPPSSAGAGEAGPLDDALRAWRLERSRADSVPAYVVFSNATLAEIAAARPANERELSRISGIGPTKLERYGADILRVVSETSG